MRGQIIIKEEAPDIPDAVMLMEELSNSLEAITGDSGRSSFHPSDISGEKAVFVVARNGQGEAVGCGAIRPLEEGTAEIKRMYAKEKGRGIGAEVLSYLEAKAEMLGYSCIRLETRLENHRAVTFYASKGYHRIPNYGRYVNRPEAVCFEKLLQKDGIHIGKAKADDAPALTDISFRAKRYWNYPEEYFDIWKDELTITEQYIHHNTIYVARSSGKAVGYYSIAEVKEDFWAGRVFVRKGFWLEHIFVLPEHIGKGVGSKLINHAKSICKGVCGRLYIFSDPNARGFYDRIGARYMEESPSSIAGRTVSLYQLELGCEE